MAGARRVPATDPPGWILSYHAFFASMGRSLIPQFHVYGWCAGGSLRKGAEDDAGTRKGFESQDYHLTLYLPPFLHLPQCLMERGLLLVPSSFMMPLMALSAPWPFCQELWPQSLVRAILSIFFESPLRFL